VLFALLLLTSVRAAVSASALSPDNRTTVILVVGAPGEAEYGSNFLRQAALWQKACSEAHVGNKSVGLDVSGSTNDSDLLRHAIAAEPKEGAGQLWLVLIGHGTFDGKEAWFNLLGPDVSATELADWLRPFRRPLAVIDTTACSGPFVNKLSGTNRVIITATRSGNEQNYARFGQFLAEALTGPEADLDQDDQVSLLEAFLTASRHASEFYKAQGRLVSEHALLDDNGDGLGTPADWFRGLRATKKAKDGAALDGLLAQQFCLVHSPAESALTPEQVAERDALERAVLLHREAKAHLPEDDYYRELEKLLLQLAKFYAAPDTNTVPLR
jgi:hypothetical protein